MKDYCLVRHDAENSAALDMPAVGPSETSVKIYQTIRRHIPEDFITIALRNSSILLFVILSCQDWSPEQCGAVCSNRHFAKKKNLGFCSKCR